MNRMPAQFLLNLFIALLWVLLRDEDTLRFSTFFGGFLIGIGIIFFMHRFFGRQFYLRRFYCVVKLVLIFISELLQSSYVVLVQILNPKLDIKPGIFTYETELELDWEISVLAMLLTLTPGSVVMEVTPDRNKFYIHGMDLEKSKDSLLRSLAKFEKAIMEVSR